MTIGFNFYQLKRRISNLNNNRENYIDKLRFFAICGVIIIHTTARTLERTGYNLNIYNFSLLLNQFARFAVPLFFIISGFVLELSSKESFNFKTYIKKRFSKIFIPYTFWSFFYYLFVYTGNNGGVWRMLLTGNGSYQLYFIPTLCIFYLLFPILHKLRERLGYPLLILLIPIHIYVTQNDYFIKNFTYPDPIRISILGFIYFLIGIYASHYKETLKYISEKYKLLLAFLFIAIGYYIFKEGLSGYFRTYNINSFYSSWRPSTFLYTLVSGFFFLNIFDKIDFSKLSKLSFLVFFIHVYVLEIVWKYASNFISPSYYFDIILFLIVSGISFFIANMAHKIPGISKIIG